MPGLPRGQLPLGPRQRTPGSGDRTDWLRAIPVGRAGAAGASEMAAGAVVGSPLISGPHDRRRLAPGVLDPNAEIVTGYYSALYVIEALPMHALTVADLTDGGEAS
jgi:hypothetical protein